MASEMKHGRKGSYDKGCRCSECKTAKNQYNRISRLRMFNLDEVAFAHLVVKQQGKCEICKREFGSATPSIDHDHDTGRVRGLLCRNCNLGIGHFGESMLNVKNAFEYLARAV